MSIYKAIDLFGNEQIKIATGLKKKPNLFTHYEAFVDKFEAKKTTDDCYTPKPVFEAVLSYVAEKYDLTGKAIIRPFYPGGDYEAIEYPENAVVIDNPPFSIISKIARFYIRNNVPFFLFAPHLTLFGADIGCTRLVVGADVVYENGAVVKTSFLSNMLGDYGVIGDPVLYDRIEQAQAATKVGLPKYEYPDNVLTVSMVAWMVERGVSFAAKKSEVAFCRGLDSQKPHKKGIFGNGFLISDSAAQRKAAAEKAAAEKAAAEKAAAEKAAAEKENIITWELSPRELEIINNLNSEQ